MFESSRDFLNLALTLAVLVLTFLTGWILVHIIRIFNDVRRIMEDVTKAIEKFNSVLEFTQEKVKNAAALIPFLIKGSEKVADVVRSMREKRNRSEDETEKQNKNKRKKSSS